MKAIAWTKYGSPDVLQLTEVAKPIPKDDEVLIRIRAATVTAGDSEMRRLQFPIWLALPIRIWLGFLKPRGKILGQEFAGEIESIGKDVHQFKVGDQVFAAAGMALGGYAEYACLPADSAIVIKPATMTYEEAAALPVGGMEALHFLKKANIQQGEKVLINGAGGSIGTVAVQLAKSFGAEVTAVDSTAKLEMLRSIGADHVIDYTQEDFTKNGETHDVIFDVVGKTSFSKSVRLLKENGRYLLANAGITQMIRGARTSNTSTKQVITGTADHNTEDLIFLKELVEAGKLKVVIDKRYPLEQVAEAHRYVDTGQKAGNVVITVSHK
jgi:2-desacetyl-2-hydroxyethyl bacteriochlorophyllide A dehydrogenase